MAEVTGVSIEYLSPTEIRQLSVVQVTEANAFGHLQATPLPGGLYDLRMGPVNRGDVCKTCGLTSECPGHCGHIELVSEVYNPFLVRRMLLLLKKMCTKCGRFRLKADLTERLVGCFKLIAAGMETEESMVILSLIDDVARSNIEKEALAGPCTDHISWFDASNDQSWEEDTTRSKLEIEKVVKGLKTRFSEDQRRRNFDLKTAAARSGHNPLTTAATTTGEHQAIASRVDAFLAAIPPQRCENCQAHPDGFRIDGYSKLFVKPRGANQSLEMFVTPLQAKAYLTRLFETESEILRFIVPGAKTQKQGLFFLENISVPPNRFRPLRALGGGGGSSMYLPVSSVALKAVLDANDVMKKELEGGQATRGGAGSALVALQDSVNSYMDAAKNPKAANPDSIKVGVRQVLERKQGLFRMKMMGKRVNYAARSVISPDVSLETNQIGIPLFIAKELTVPEPVNTFNVDYLRQLVENGPDQYPGAVSVNQPDGRVLSLIGRSAEQRKGIASTLLVDSAGADGVKVVNRHLRNGDPLLVNRQPTLHKPGIMALQVRVLKREKTIRMHYSNCTTFNADFDGDEINLHCPQDSVARSEALRVANADMQFLGPTAGQPLRGLIQDHVIGGTILTSRDTFLSREQFFQLLYVAMRAALERSTVADTMLTGPGECKRGKSVAKLDGAARTEKALGRLVLPRPAILKPEPLWTGKQLVTAFLRALVFETTGSKTGLFVEGKSRTQGDLWGGKLDGNKEEEIVLIMNGELLQGVLDKNAFGNANGGLIHVVYELLGAKVAGLLLTGMSRLFTLFLQSQGFTCAMGDLLVKPAEEKERHKLLREAVVGGWAKLRGLCAEEGVDGPQDEDVEMFDSKLSPLANNLKTLIQRERGNKASPIFAKIEGLMLANSSEYWGKCIDAILPKGQAVPFPKNCFSAMVNTGAKGSKVNQSQICCLLGQQELEGHRVPLLASMRTLPSFAPFDFSARAGGFISDRFLSGVRPQEFFFHCMAGREGLIDTAVKTARSGYLQRCLVKHLECLTVQYDHTVRDSDASIVQFAYGEDGVDVTRSSYLNKLKVLDANRTFMKKVDPQRAQEFDSEIATAYEALRRKPKSERRREEFSQLLLADAARGPSKLSADERLALASSVDSGRFDPIQALVSPSRFLGAVSEAHAARVHSYLKSENPKAPEELEELLNLKFLRSLADAGEAVGTLAAQGMGEPSTQMTLNTFHLAGHGGANVTLGIPRLREIVQTASRKISTPSMHIPCSVSEAKNLQAVMERVALRELVLATHVSEKVAVDVTGAKFRVYELVLDLANLGELAEVYPALTREAVAKFFDREFRAQLDRDVKKLIRSSNANAEVKIQKAINDLTGSTGGVARRPATEDAEEEPEEGGRKKKAIDDAEPEDREESENDEEDTEGQYSSDSSASSDSESENVKGESANRPLSGSNSSTSETSDSEDEAVPLRKGVTTENAAAAKRARLAATDAVRAAIALQKSGGDDVFCLPGQLHDEKFILRSRELKLTERVSKKILILEVVEDLCGSLFLQSTPGISRVIVGEKGIDTEGVNLDIFWAMPDIAHNKLRTNDIALMLDRYGVEVCRLSIVNEISRVFGHYGISVDRRHLSLIADYMTHQGGYRPFNRAGMAAHASPFLKMTFETSVNFLTAACHDGLADNLRSPAAALIMGKLAPIGTGVFSLRNVAPLKQKSLVRPMDEGKHFVFEDSESDDEMVINEEDE